jgi:hypothetical protein
MITRGLERRARGGLWRDVSHKWWFLQQASIVSGVAADQTESPTLLVGRSENELLVLQ